MDDEEFQAALAKIREGSNRMGALNSKYEQLLKKNTEIL